jgi:hypothetical protein
LPWLLNRTCPQKGPSPSSVLPSDRVCQHGPRTATQPDSFKFLIPAAQLETTVWIRISSASFTSLVMKSMRTEPSCGRWSHFEHRLVSGRNSPFLRRIGFSAKPPLRWPLAVAPSPAYQIFRPVIQYHKAGNNRPVSKSMRARGESICKRRAIVYQSQSRLGGIGDANEWCALKTALNWDFLYPRGKAELPYI